MTTPEPSRVTMPALPSPSGVVAACARGWRKPISDQGRIRPSSAVAVRSGVSRRSCACRGYSRPGAGAYAGAAHLVGTGGDVS
jgi:hypothetical protein